MFRLKCFTIILFFTVCSCTSVKPASKLQVGLFPVHKPAPPIASDGSITTKLIDNDGNLYVSNWKVKEGELERFEAIRSKCVSIIPVSIFSKGPPLIDKLSLDVVKPTNYKNFVSCISSHGYTMSSAQGFYPQGFNLYLNRTQNYEGQYMPVGGALFIDVKTKNYLEILTKAQKCDLITREELGSSVEDRSIGGFSYVSIESYAETIMSCILGRKYNLEET